MDFFYSKQMGNGTVALKFRFSSKQSSAGDGPQAQSVSLSPMESSKSTAAVSTTESYFTARNSSLRTNGGDSDIPSTSSTSATMTRSIPPIQQLVAATFEAQKASQAPLVAESNSEKSSDSPPSGSTDPLEVSSLEDNSNSAKAVDTTLLVLPSTATTSSDQKLDDDDDEDDDVDMDAQENKEDDKSSPVAANNCTRCYRLKKKCTRSLPKCSNCTKSGADCEYVMRNKKRKRRITFRIVNEHLEPPTHSAASVSSAQPSTVFTSYEDGPTTISLSEPTATKDKSVTVSSMLTSSFPQSTGIRKSPYLNNRRTFQRPESGKSTGRDHLVLGRIFKNKGIENQTSTLQDEFITMNSFENDSSLPQVFVVNYFYNYCLKYPFMNEEEFMNKFKNINFSKESIVPLDVYLVMAIGALIYDVQRGSKYFTKFFNEKQIENIIDVVNVNIDESADDLELENIVILLLLAVYALIVNHDILWGLTGVLDRVVVQTELYKKSTIRHNNALMQRLYWSIFNIDIEISLIKDKVPQLPTYRQWTLPFTESLYPQENLELVNLQMEMYDIIRQIVDLKSRKSIGKLAHEELNGMLNGLLKALDKWRKNMVAIYHTELATKTYLEECVAQCNLNYYFLLIEIDQMSSSESLQFTLQFLANLFTLMMNELVVAQTPLPPREPRPLLPPSPSELDYDDTNSSQILKFTNGMATSNLIVMLCHHKMYKVIRCSLKSLVRILEGTMKDKQNGNSQMFGIEELRLSEFSLNLQLMINLLKCIMNRVPENENIQLCLATLLKVNERLLRLEALGEGPSRDDLKLDLASIVKNNMRLFNY